MDSSNECQSINKLGIEPVKVRLPQKTSSANEKIKNTAEAVTSANYKREHPLFGDESHRHKCHEQERTHHNVFHVLLQSGWSDVKNITIFRKSNALAYWYTHDYGLAIYSPPHPLALQLSSGTAEGR